MFSFCFPSECYGCAGCDYAVQGIGSCELELGCPSSNLIYTSNTPPAHLKSPPPPSFHQSPSNWQYVGVFVDYTNNVRVMKLSPNQGTYGAAFYPGTERSLPVSTTVVDCISWGVSNGLDTIGIQFGGYESYRTFFCTKIVVAVSVMGAQVATTRSKALGFASSSLGAQTQTRSTHQTRATWKKRRLASRSPLL